MPTGKGGNLTQPLKKVLINQPNADNLGAYRDDQIGSRVLQFKQHGYSLIANGQQTVAVQQPQPHVHRVTTFQISNVSPVNRLNFNYGFNVSQRVRTPGVQNSKFYSHQKPYGGVLPFVDAVTISNAQLNTMRDNIIAQVNADNGYTRRFEYELPGSAVVASHLLHLDTWDAASAMTLDTLAVAAEATIGAFVANINALPGYFAWLNPAVPATEIFVVKTTRAVTPGTLAVFANTAGTIAAAAAQPNGLIALVNRHEGATFEVTLNEPSFGTATIVRPGNFALLTNDEVQRVFSHIPNDGYLAQERRHPNLVLPGVDYVCITITVPQLHYDLGGASHQNMFLTAIEVYMPAAEWNVVLAAAVNERWAAAAGAPLRMMDAGNVNNITDLIAWWQA